MIYFSEKSSAIEEKKFGMNVDDPRRIDKQNE